MPGDTAGSNPLPFETADDWIAAIVFGELVRPPGRGFAYASAGSHLLSAILVEATSRSVLDYAREKLFDPLGISTESAAEPLPSSKTCRSTRRHPSHGPSTRKGATPRSLTVADEYFAVTDKVEARYGKAQWLSADAIGPKMARLRREHHRLLGNGYCTRPPELDCAFESICENCSFFQTSIEFRPTLQGQHDHAASHANSSGADMFQRLLNSLNQNQSS